MFLTSQAPFGLDLQTDGVFFSKYSSRRVIILNKKIATYLLYQSLELLFAILDINDLTRIVLISK